MGARERRGAVALAGIAVVAAVAAGCGIRPTVPVDGGPAPSRVPCGPSGEGASSRARQDAGTGVRIHLVCGSGLETVERTVAEPDAKGPDSRVTMARTLLGLLQADPPAHERAAGFTTYVRPPLTVSAARAGDPAGTLRLSRQPEDLPPAALSQIVCTYAENAATSVGGAVLLGGPGEYPARRWACTAEVKERPETPLPARSP